MTDTPTTVPTEDDPTATEPTRRAGADRVPLAPEDEQYLQRLATKIDALRQTAGLSIAGLARDAELDEKAMRTILRGKRVPSLPILFRISRALGRRLDVDLL